MVDENKNILEKAKQVISGKNDNLEVIKPKVRKEEKKAEDMIAVAIDGNNCRVFIAASKVKSFKEKNGLK